MRKQLFALVLSGGLMVYSVGGALAAGSAEFTDLPEDWSRPAIERAIEDGLLNGANGKIDAYGTLTRSQMAAIMVRAFGATAKADLSGYSDVPADAWYHGDMAAAVAMGVFQGADGKLNPEAPITRQEAFTVLARAFVLTGGDSSALADFDDEGQVASWAREAVAALVSGGYVKGSDGKLMPAATMTRAEFAQMVSNLVAEFDTPAGEIRGNVVLRKGENLPAGTVIHGDLIVAEGVGVSALDLTGVTITGRVVVRGGAEVKLDQDTSVGSLVLTNSTGPVKVVNDGGAKASVTVVGGQSVTLEGAFGEVTVGAAGAEVTLQSGRVDRVTVESGDVTVNVGGSAAVGTVSVQPGADSAKVDVDKGGKITTVETAAADTAITGKGQVSKVEAQAGSEGAKVTTPNTKITVDKNAGAVETGKGKVEPGKSGNSSGANNSSSGSSLSAIEITLSVQEDVTLTVGESDTVTVSALPNNGQALKSLTAVSSAPSVVSASLTEGVITIEAHQAGMATVTVTADADGCATATKSFRVYVETPSVEYPDNEAVDVAVQGSQVTMSGTLADLGGKRASVICMAPGYTGGAAGWFESMKEAVYIGEFTIEADGSFTFPFPLPGIPENGVYILLIGGGDTIILDSFAN